MKLTKQEKSNLLEFLDRVETRGIKEALILVSLASKLEKSMMEKDPKEQDITAE